MSLKIETTIHSSPGGESAPVIAAHLIGRIDSTTVQELTVALDHILEGSIHQCVLDLEGVEYISSTGVGSFFAFAESFEEADGGLCLMKVPSATRHVLDMLGVNEVLTSHDSAEEAVEYFSSSSSKSSVSTELNEEQRMAKLRSFALQGHTETAPILDRPFHVLIVVPEKDAFTQITAQQLSLKGFKVFISTKAEDTLRVIRAKQVDIAVVDYLFENRDALIKEIKSDANCPTSSIFTLHEANWSPDAVTGVQVVGNGYIAEPFEIPQFCDLVASECQRYWDESSVLKREIHWRMACTEADVITFKGIIEGVIGNGVCVDDERSSRAIVSAIMAGIDNACKHGNKWAADSVVDIFLFQEDNRLIVTVKDDGEGFKWQGKLDADVAPTNPETIGLPLMQHCMDMIMYNSKGNELTMVKEIA